MTDKSKSVSSSKSIKSWISVAFDDFDTGVSSKTSSDGFEAETKPCKRRRDETVSSSNRSSTFSQIPKSNLKRLQDASELWVEKYAPATKEDLAVHKKKVAEVEEWMTANLQMSKIGKSCGIALLTGPAGVGKTATVKVLVKERGLQVHEWSNPISNTNAEWEQSKSYPTSDYRGFQGFSVSQTQQFQDFLLRANRYQSLQFSSQESTEKLILIEELPNQFFRDTQKLHQILRNFLRICRTPLIIIMSDSAGGDSNQRLLFPPDIQSELAIHNISFNPIATTMMTKVLQKIYSTESAKQSQLGSLSKSDTESLISGSSGDIRAAVNALQFSRVSKCSVTKSKSRKRQTGSSKSTKSTKTSQKGAAAESGAIGSRDNSLFLFRALGRILYCKRGDAKDFPEERPLPDHHREHQRSPLLVDPEDVVEKSQLSGGFFLSYLHQNYLDFFTDIDCVVRATEYLSDADTLSMDWVSRSTMQEYAASVATRGLMHSNISRGPSTNKWRPLHKPAWFGAMKQARENSFEAKSLFRVYNWFPRELQTQIIPFFCRQRMSAFTARQRSFLQVICQFKGQTYSAARSQRLDEKDVDLDDSDKDEAPLTTADPEDTTDMMPSTSEEDFIIEDFDD